MTYKILVTSRSFGQVSEEPIKLLEQNNCSIDFKKESGLYGEEDFLKVIGEYDAVIVGADHMTAKVIEAGKKLKIICKHGAGVDNIDCEKAKEMGIPVTNVPATNSDAVADFAFGLILNIARKISANAFEVKRGKWNKDIGVDVCKKTLGIIGCGAIGRRVAKRGQGFDMRVLGYDPYVKESANLSNIELVDLETLIKESDFISIHVPLTPDTRNLISSKEMHQMKKGAFIINTARGGIVDENALYQFLTNGHLGGAALDVTEQEPIQADSPLLKLDNVIITSHIASYSKESLNAVSMACARNIIKIINNETPDNIVNK
ncbi:phosphoglycerate dehydrogenase [Tepidanaerobacter sp. GT38]|uniref:phosphoglycerate dehydrogenase n=1 Tax=Tepidanaerobacter sp. GT38 TaxID=2722793 RepID=UPI001F19A7D8|nr:phosphoglycerate dehydrogenase [Tepidanaerobacter sp. GT38]MCG1011587.1 phosphoglycerate dehydrogenase [Tepidanaerobacter sp. GT38]